MPNERYVVKTINQIPEAVGNPVNYKFALQAPDVNGVPGTYISYSLQALVAYIGGAGSTSGLENVDNTSDLLKPISNAVSAALDNKADLVLGVLKESQRQDIISIHLTATNFPATGDLKRFYFAKDTGILNIYSAADNQYFPINGASTTQVENYTHNQTVASDTWTITHPLNKLPSVMVISSANIQIFGTVEFVGTTGVIVTFDSPQAGIASLN